MIQESCEGEIDVDKADVDVPEVEIANDVGETEEVSS